MIISRGFKCVLGRPTIITSRFSSSIKKEKTVYQIHEEGEKERTVYGEAYPEWRKTWIKREGEFKSKLHVFVEKSPNPDVLSIMQKIPEMNIQKVKTWWASMHEIKERRNQMYLPERVTMLGPNLAAMHYFTYRGASVRLKNSEKWYTGDPMDLKLPSKFVDGYKVEAIDCEKFVNGLRYEAFENLLELTSLKWLRLRNNTHVDVWCIDKVAGLVGNSLQYLDVSGCNFQPNWVYALARMSTLKHLVISDPHDNIELQTAISVLEEDKKDLLVQVV